MSTSTPSGGSRARRLSNSSLDASSLFPIYEDPIQDNIPLFSDLESTAGNYYPFFHLIFYKISIGMSIGMYYGMRHSAISFITSSIFSQLNTDFEFYYQDLNGPIRTKTVTRLARY